jgi:hypothetical protein
MDFCASKSIIFNGEARRLSARARAKERKRNEMKKKTTERPGVPALSPKDTRSDYDDDDDDETLRASFDSKQQTRKQKRNRREELFADENTSFGPPSPALEAITFTTTASS